MKKLILLFLLFVPALSAATLTLGVKLYSQTANLNGIPGAWPAEVIECADEWEEAAAERAGYTIYSVAQYNNYLASHQVQYDTWANSLSNSIYKFKLTVAVNNQADKRIQDIFDPSDPEKAKTRQQQLQARFSELTLLALRAGGITNLSVSDQAEVNALLALWAKVKAIRQVEWSKTNSLANGTNANALTGWPE